MAPRQRCIASTTSTTTTTTTTTKASTARAEREDSFDTVSSSSSDSNSTPILSTESTSLDVKHTNGKASSSIQKSSINQQQQTEADIARDKHDYFNLIALAFVVYSSSLNYELPWLTYQGGYFWVTWATTLIYFLLDLIWVTVVPICVKSPHVIVKHHIVAMMYLAAPIYYPEYRWYMGAILSVEINTWFLIARRLVYTRSNNVNNGNNETTTSVHPILASSVSILFYITWILIRCYLYPSYLIMFLSMIPGRVRETGIYFHTEMIFIPVHAALCILNLKWTYDLFTPIIKRWLFRNDSNNNKPIVVQSGL